MTTEPVQYTLVLVIIGSFNPVIINPLWLEKKGALGKKEATEAVVEVIHRDLTQFNLGWAACQITPDRFELRCDSIAFFEPSRDLFENIFKILRETPITAMGINHIITFDLAESKEFDRFGKFLAPLEIWNDSVSIPKLKTIEILEQPRSDKLPGYRQIKLEGISSSLVKYGILVNMNDHFEVNSISQMLEVVSKNWQLSFDKTKLITTSIWNQFLKAQ